MIKTHQYFKTIFSYELQVKRYTPAQNGHAHGASPWQSDTEYDDPYLHETPEQQQAFAAESAALMDELSSTGQAAFQAESTMRELAALNQMFSTQIVQQAEQIQLLYDQVRGKDISGCRLDPHVTKEIIVTCAQSNLAHFRYETNRRQGQNMQQTNLPACARSCARLSVGTPILLPHSLSRPANVAML